LPLLRLTEDAFDEFDLNQGHECLLCSPGVGGSSKPHVYEVLRAPPAKSSARFSKIAGPATPGRRPRTARIVRALRGRRGCPSYFFLRMMGSGRPLPFLSLTKTL